jgi:hypothetical protein
MAKQRDGLISIIMLLLTIAVVSSLPRSKDTVEGCPFGSSTVDQSYKCQVKSIVEEQSNFVTFQTQDNKLVKYHDPNRKFLNFEQYKNLELELRYDGRLGSFIVLNMKVSNTVQEITDKRSIKVNFSEKITKGERFYLPGYEEAISASQDYLPGVHIVELTEINNDKIK